MSFWFVVSERSIELLSFWNQIKISSFSYRNPLLNSIISWPKSLSSLFACFFCSHHNWVRFVQQEWQVRSSGCHRPLRVQVLVRRKELSGKHWNDLFQFSSRSKFYQYVLVFHTPILWFSKYLHHYRCF